MLRDKPLKACPCLAATVLICVFMLGISKLVAGSLSVMLSYWLLCTCEVFTAQAGKPISIETWLHSWAHVMVLTEDMADREFLSSSTTSVDIQCALHWSQLGPSPHINSGLLNISKYSPPILHVAWKTAASAVHHPQSLSHHENQEPKMLLQTSALGYISKMFTRKHPTAFHQVSVTLVAKERLAKSHYRWSISS